MLILSVQEKLLQLCGVDVPHGMLIRCLNCQWKGILDSLFRGRKCEHCEHESLVEERQYLLGNMTPIKVPGSATWSDAVAAAQTLITYNIPRTPYLLIYRIETYTVNFTSGAADFGNFEPVPDGTSYWQKGPYGATAGGTNTEALTSVTDTWATCDADEFLIIEGGQNAQLVVTLTAGPTDEEREVRALMYGLLLGSAVIESLAANQNTILNV